MEEVVYYPLHLVIVIDIIIDIKYSNSHVYIWTVRAQEQATQKRVRVI